MYKVCHEATQPPSLVSGKAALARFDTIALRALAKRPEERYLSAGKFRGDLLDAYAHPVSPSVSEETLIRDAGGPVDSGEASSQKSGSRKPSSATPSSAASALGSARAPQVPTIPTQMLVAAGWNVEELASVERSLARFIGPIARVMVRRAALEVKDCASLVQRLADQMPVPADRAKFLQANSRFSMAGTGPSKAAPAADDDATVIPGGSRSAPATVATAPSEEEIARAARLLAVHLGPIAPVLVRQAAQPGVSRAAFLARLTTRLSDAEKERFLNDFARPR
jgi:serine/threonine-protein kinase